MAYFDIQRDIEIETTGGFFCQACVVGKPASEQSPDPRYCLGCYEFLLHEASLLNPRNRPRWVPRAAEQAKIGTQKVNKVEEDTSLIMSPINDQKSKVDIIRPETPKVTFAKRGPKITELPDDLIRQWASEGVGSKAISTRLKAKGYFVSYKTIQRRLQGVLV